MRHFREYEKKCRMFFRTKEKCGNELKIVFFGSNLIALFYNKKNEAR